jgi:hypothetical protein
VCGVFGAAAAAARLRGLGRAVTGHALGIAGSLRASPWSSPTAGTVCTQGPPLSGILAASVAAHGGTGPATLPKAASASSPRLPLALDPRFVARRSRLPLGDPRSPSAVPGACHARAHRRGPPAPWQGDASIPTTSRRSSYGCRHPRSRSCWSGAKGARTPMTPSSASHGVA